MKVLVTGGAGYIGSVCVEQLVLQGHRVTVFDNLTEGHRAAVHPEATFVQGDLGDTEKVFETLREAEAEAVLHFAANALVGESMTNPGKYFGNNVAKGISLLDAVVRANVKKFVFSSTCAVYGLPGRVPITEDLPQQPVNPYGESKWIFERVLAWYSRIHGLEQVIFRYFNAAGASRLFGEHHRIESHLIPNVLKVALGQAEQCEIYGTDYPTADGTCVRDYIHVIDLAAAHILALQPEVTGIFNLGNGDGHSVREVIQMCEKVSGKPIPWQAKERRPGDPPRLVAGAGKALNELGWKPQVNTLESIVGSAWQWHQQHPEGYPNSG